MSRKIEVGDTVQTAPLIFGGKVTGITHNEKQKLRWIEFKDNEGNHFSHLEDELEIVEDEQGY